MEVTEKNQANVLGFQDGKNAIFINEKNYQNKFSEYISDPNNPKWIEIAEDGQKYAPVMLHRALFGSIERFIGILIENYSGRLPLWLSPVQIVIATITSDANHYAEEVLKAFKENNLRAEIYIRND